MDRKSKVMRLAVVLQTDVTLERPVFHCPLIELDVGNLFAVKIDLQVIANAGNNHTVPLIRRTRHVFCGTHGTNNAPVIMVPQRTLPCFDESRI